MKGVMMKAGQMVSFIMEALPDDAQRSLSSLYADAPPMDPALARRVIIDELGTAPEKVFLDWSPDPIAAASVGQVHRVVLRDGRDAAVKIQYPGVGDAGERKVQVQVTLVGIPICVTAGVATNVAKLGKTGGTVTTTGRITLPALLVQVRVYVVIADAITLVVWPRVTAPTPLSIVHVGSGNGSALGRA